MFINSVESSIARSAVWMQVSSVSVGNPTMKFEPTDIPDDLVRFTIEFQTELLSYTIPSIGKSYVSK